MNRHGDCTRDTDCCNGLAGTFGCLEIYALVAFGSDQSSSDE